MFRRVIPNFTQNAKERILTPPTNAQGAPAPMVLWSSQLARKVIQAAAREQLFTTQLYTGNLLLFASSDNDVNVTVGSIELTAADVQFGASFDLAPGRSALLYTEDQLVEKFDASKWFLTHPDPAAAQLVYVTIWTPTFL